MIHPVLSVSKLYKTFTLHDRGAEVPAISNLDFKVPAGSITALSGPSGAGKSSVLKCIYRTYVPNGGSIFLRCMDFSADLATADDHTVLAARAAHMGFVTQFLHCLPRKSSLEVVASPLLSCGIQRDEALSRAAELLSHLGIPERLWPLAPATFSGGEQQRVNIARGFIRPNALLLLDEPTASLDPVSAEAVLELVQRAREAGTAVVGIWHDSTIVNRLADQVVSVQPVLGAALS
ncbi:MAG: phosphonate C-P lyase system protein PhnL [Planctomycetota bacterium]|nr:MAG: phosphonate C-P lyase system protein PhnL [Planctomycetota bacterium]